MKKIHLVLILLITFSCFTKAQDISSVIFSIPDDLTLKIPDDQKEILASSPDTTTITVRNILGENIERIAMSKDYVAIKTSDFGMLEIKLLPLINNTYIIGVIRSVCDMTCDSQIDFYTTEWKHLSTAELFPQKDKYWFINSTTDKESLAFKNASAALDMTPVTYAFSPEDDTITAIYNIKQYISPDDYKLLEPFLSTNPVTFVWDKTSFKR